jgi:hypothetical protein
MFSPSSAMIESRAATCIAVQVEQWLWRASSYLWRHLPYRAEVRYPAAPAISSSSDGYGRGDAAPQRRGAHDILLIALSYSIRQQLRWAQIINKFSSQMSASDPQYSFHHNDRISSPTHDAVEPEQRLRLSEDGVVYGPSLFYPLPQQRLLCFLGLRCE